MSFSNLVRISIVDLDFLNFDKTHPILTDCLLSQAQRRFDLKGHIYDCLKKCLKEMNNVQRQKSSSFKEKIMLSQHRTLICLIDFILLSLPKANALSIEQHRYLVMNHILLR